MINLNDLNFKEEIKKDKIFVIIFIGILITTIIIYPQAPEKMAIHWNLKGEADTQVNKIIGLFILPLIGLLIYLYNLSQQKNNQKKSDSKYRRDRRFSIVIVMVVQLFIIISSL